MATRTPEAKKRGAVGDDLPRLRSSEWNAAWKSVGLVSESGVTLSGRIPRLGTVFDVDYSNSHRDETRAPKSNDDR
jgi:hypothetical protein